MKNKNIILSLILAFSIILPTMAQAAIYHPKGERQYNMDSVYIVESRDVITEGNSVTTEGASGIVSYDFFVPFDCESMTIYYSCEQEASISMNAGQYSASVKLPSNASKQTVKFNKVIRRGEIIADFKINGTVSISKIAFDKASMENPVDITNYPTMVKATDYEKAIQASVIIDEKAPVIIVRGQRRYIDNDNIKRTPYNIDGTVYLPAKTLALALGYYYEDYPEKSYVLMRKDGKEYTFLEGNAYKERVYFEDKLATQCYLKYIDGVAYLPVRYFAEEISKNVGWSNGIIIIDDDRFEIDNIIKNHIDTIKNTFKEFYPVNTENKTYYVSQKPGASDANDGSEAFPFKTLTRAGKVAKAGDTVIIGGGTYREIFSPKNDGTAANPITFKAKDGEKVVISALEEVGNFLPYKDKMYISNIDWDLGEGRNMVFHNGKVLVEARYPNGPEIEMSPRGNNLSELFPVKGDIHAIADKQNKIMVSDTLLDQPEDYWKGAIVVSMHGYGWSLSTGKVTASEKGKLYIGDTARQWWYEPEKEDKENYAYLTGHINAIDIPGEWEVVNNSLIIIPPEGENPDTMKLEVKKRQLVIDMADRKFVRIEGIDTIGGGVKMNNSEMCAIDRCNLSYVSHYIHGKDQREGYIYTADRNNPDDAPQRGEVGIYVGGTDNIITNSKIDTSAAAGILIVGTYAYIENNIIANCGYAGSYVSGVTFGNEFYKGMDVRKGGFALYNNTIYNSGRSVLNIQNPDKQLYSPILPYEVAYNDFHDGILTSLDTGITYEYQTYAKTDKLESSYHNNYVYYTASKTNPYGFGIYHDGGTTGIDTYDNIVFTTEKGVIFSQRYIHKYMEDNNVWNNSMIKVGLDGGPEKLVESDFPHSKPYYAGAKDKQYLKNYENVKNNAENYKFYDVKDAVLSEGVSLDAEGFVKPDGDKQYIEFKNVDFTEGKNNINIVFRGDRYNTNDIVDVYVGDSLENATGYTNNIFISRAKREYYDDLYAIGTEKIDKVTNVYIKIKNNKSTRIKGISINDRGKPAEVHDGNRIYGGHFNNVEKVGNKSMPPEIKGGPDKIHSFANNVWTGTVLRYNNVTVKENANVLTYSAGSGSDYGNQEITIAYNKRGEAGNIQIAKFMTKEDGWHKYTTEYVDLEKTLEAGVYDIYVSFGKRKNFTQGGESGTCNFWFFGFLPEMPQE